jgi:hypothetical protein
VSSPFAGKKIWPQIIDVMSDKKENIMKSLLLSLSSHVDPDEVTAAVNQHFSQYFDTITQDISKKLMAFLVSVMGNNSKTVRILKACNQSIIASSVVRLKRDLGQEFPYFDVQGGWRIIITISEDDIQVIHRKW